MDVNADTVTTPPEVSVVIPAYGSAEALRQCLESLARYVPKSCNLWIVDDATPDDSIRKTYDEMRHRFPRLNYHRNEENLGFVKTCNLAFRQLRNPGTDLLLLNSDTRVTKGFLQEMQDVLYLHDRHGVVTPRSNNATTFSIPWNGGLLSAPESFRVWKRIRRLLPRYQVMPTAVGFCMLIKAEVLDRFGLFDDAYSPGYNEENDFVCRINRYGYSAVAANQAYVFHFEKSSFGDRRESLESAHHEVLVGRYPEYDSKLTYYCRFVVDPVEFFAHLYARHRPRILFDFFDWPAPGPASSGSLLHLFREASRLLEPDVDVVAGFRESQTFFARELSGNPSHSDSSGTGIPFDLVFRPSQIFTWDEFRTMNRLGARVSYVSLGTINVRSDYLNSPERYLLFRKAAELSDCVFASNGFARSDFMAFYGTDAPMRLIQHGNGMDAISEPGEAVDGGQHAAEQYACAFREILAADVDVVKLRSRWDTIRLLDSSNSH